MQFLFITTGGMLSAAKRVQLEGNDVQVFDPTGRAQGEGYVPVIRELALRPDTVVIFDAPGHGRLADSLRSEGWPVVGGGEFNDRIESDYRQTLALLHLATIPTGLVRAVSTMDEGLKEMAQHPALQTLRPIRDRRRTVYPGEQLEGPFIVMEQTTGPEEFFGGWFNGSDWLYGGFYSSVCERQFMTGGLGEDVKFAGGITFFYKHARPALIKKTLLKLSRFLVQRSYRGPVGCWITGDRALGLSFSFEQGIWPSLHRLIGGDLGRFFADLARGLSRRMRVKDSYCAGLLLSTPPYPAEYGIVGAGPTRFEVPGDLLVDFHPVQGKQDGTEFVAEGKIGYLTHQASSVSGLSGLYDKVKRFKVLNLQYRTDILAPQVQSRVRQLLRRVSSESGELEIPAEPMTGAVINSLSEATEQYRRREV